MDYSYLESMVVAICFYADGEWIPIPAEDADEWELRAAGLTREEAVALHAHALTIVTPAE